MCSDSNEVNSTPIRSTSAHVAESSSWAYGEEANGMDKSQSAQKVFAATDIVSRTQTWVKCDTRSMQVGPSQKPCAGSSLVPAHTYENKVWRWPCRVGMGSLSQAGRKSPSPDGQIIRARDYRKHIQ